MASNEEKMFIELQNSAPLRIVDPFIRAQRQIIKKKHIMWWTHNRIIGNRNTSQHNIIYIIKYGTQ